ncbi:MAG: hypothetical protein DWQ07_21190 [Chloroflexi bacterium]|nr:MAG: hypothetical protein DWQ07_21190 [Chloroflexota bacterium]MBL1194599.1 hypothetical protein [Chloroflexota bacterium]NOH11889.1 hypothetical protein [Chloroflexota bacterium]
MSSKTIARKMFLKDEHRLLLLHAPEGYDKILHLPPDIETSIDAEGKFDMIQTFLSTEAALKEELPKLKAMLNPDGKLWVSYPKGTSENYASEINRDTIWPLAQEHGLEGDRMISIDDDWSSMRFKLAK